MNHQVKRYLRLRLEKFLAWRGYNLVPHLPVADAWATKLFDETTPLPPDAEDTLRSDHPRLMELRATYVQLNLPVCERTLWLQERLDWLDLRYFRGDNPYVWQYREGDRRTSALKYFIFLEYVLDRDPRSLVETLGEDGAFGCWAYRFPGYPPCSRDLLDSVNEINFLERHGVLRLGAKNRILDIGAGYGRLAHRVSQAFDLTDYVCVDAIPESTFLCEYYIAYRSLAPTVRVFPLTEVSKLQPSELDVAFNVHSFSEMPRVAVQWWVEWLLRLQIPTLFIVPNESEGFLTTESDGTRLDYCGVLASAGYKLIVEEHKFLDEAVRGLVGAEDRYCLFALN